MYVLYSCDLKPSTTAIDGTAESSLLVFRHAPITSYPRFWRPLHTCSPWKVIHKHVTGPMCSLYLASLAAWYAAAVRGPNCTVSTPLSQGPDSLRRPLQALPAPSSLFRCHNRETKEVLGYRYGHNNRQAVRQCHDRRAFRVLSEWHLTGQRCMCLGIPGRMISYSGIVPEISSRSRF
jgi:hypothetical protein